ncbi:MAG: Rho termination factor N-terminal domain-containing protein, partial [Bifidobacteriaceae bacterium]|nr:Rho termination factor N-terminal domain-containing protein [Bifidobacteriaceae bacterium]
MTTTNAKLPPLGSLRLAELQSLAASMGIKGTSRMRKADLIAAVGASTHDPVAPAPVEHRADAGRRPRRSGGNEATDRAARAAEAANLVKMDLEATAGARRPRRAAAAAGAPGEVVASRVGDDSRVEAPQRVAEAARPQATPAQGVSAGAGQTSKPQAGSQAGPQAGQQAAQRPSRAG